MCRIRYSSAILAAIGIVTIGVVQFQAQSRAKVRPIQHIKDNLYWISGGDLTDRPTWTGGNTAVFVTEQGAVVIDTMLPNNGAGIIEQVKSITDKPIIMIINTHTHGDHTGSDTEFPANIQVVAHQNTKVNMAAMPAFQGDKTGYLPQKTFADKMSLFSGKDQIDLYYFGSGHTNGDIWVVFPALHVMHSGDVFARKGMPLCDLTNHGDALANEQTLAKAVKGIKNVDTIITGHAPSLLKWSDLVEYHDFYKEFADTVRKGFKAGKAADEVAAAYKPSPRYQSYDVNPDRVKADVQSIFAGLKK